MTSTASTAAVAFGPFEARTSDFAAGARASFQARDLLLRAAAFVVLTTASTALLALPYLGDAPDRSAAAAPAAPSSRLEQAFQVAQAMPAQTELSEALSAVARKVDRLAAGPDCGAQTWPNIAARCLAGTDAAGSASPIRTVTVEYRMGENTSALVRLPVQRLASQP